MLLVTANVLAIFNSNCIYNINMFFFIAVIVAILACFVLFAMFVVFILKFEACKKNLSTGKTLVVFSDDDYQYEFELQKNIIHEFT